MHRVLLVTGALDAILDAVSILERHPAIGRLVVGMLRELVISFGASGCVALYRVHPSARVEMLAVRHQKDAGFG